MARVMNPFLPGHDEVDQAVAKLLCLQILDVVQLPACVEFRMDDGSTVCLFDACDDYSRVWRVEEAA